MIRILLFALFASMVAMTTLNVNTVLAPGVNLTNAFIYVLFLALAFETVVTRQRNLELLSVIVPFVLYSIYAIFSWLVVVLFVKYPGYGLRSSLSALKADTVEPLLIFLIFFYGISNQRQALRLLRSMLWVIVAANIVTVIDTLDIPDLGLMKLDQGRAEGFVGNAIQYAAIVVCFLPAIVAMYLTSSGIRKLLAGIGVLLTGLALLMTVSRGAFLGLALAGLLGAFYLRKFIPPGVIIRSGLGAVLICVIVLLGAIAAGSGEILLERFGSMMSSNSFDATSGRNVIWGRALGRMFDYPHTLAIGFGWFAYTSSDYFNYATHNTYLNSLYDLGAIGVSLYLLVAVNALRAVRDALFRAGPEARPMLISFVFGFVALLLSIFFMNFFDWIYIWAYAGVVLRLAVLQTGHEAAI